MGRTAGLCLLGLILSLLALLSSSESEQTKKLPIVFAYIVVPTVCEFGLPEYVKVSLEHSIFTQPDCEVVLLTNQGECPPIAKSVENITGLTVVDSTALTSTRTQTFRNISAGLFQKDNHNELWLTSALRFLVLEDMMQARGYQELLHAEADNLLFGRLTTALPTLRQHYPLGITPLNLAKTFLTASVFYVSQRRHLVAFNNFLMNLAQDQQGSFDKYIDWLRPSASKVGGLRARADGWGVKPFAVNEMSMLAYYHELHPDVLRLLPTVPTHAKYVRGKHVPDVTPFSPQGREIAAPTGAAIWDGGSWGQFLGGTAKKHGRDKGFTDGTHISGLGIRLSNCRPLMRCANMSELGYFTGAKPSPVPAEGLRCFTAPMVHCGEDEPFWPLWNLHVHSKDTASFRAELCSCQDSTK